MEGIHMGGVHGGVHGMGGRRSCIVEGEWSCMGGWGSMGHLEVLGFEVALDKVALEHLAEGVDELEAGADVAAVLEACQEHLHGRGGGRGGGYRGLG